MAQLPISFATLQKKWAKEKRQAFDILSSPALSTSCWSRRSIAASGCGRNSSRMLRMTRLRTSRPMGLSACQRTVLKYHTKITTKFAEVWSKTISPKGNCLSFPSLVRVPQACADSLLFIRSGSVPSERRLSLRSFLSAIERKEQTSQVAAQ